MLIITALSAAILSGLCVMLSLKVVGIRRREKISVGDNGNEELLRAIRAQANLLEYAPLAIILIACAELNGVHRLLVGLLALAFIAGRILHPVGMRDDKVGMSARVLGMQLTLISMLALIATNVLWVVWLLLT